MRDYPHRCGISKLGLLASLAPVHINSCLIIKLFWCPLVLDYRLTFVRVDRYFSPAELLSGLGRTIVLNYALGPLRGTQKTVAPVLRENTVSRQVIYLIGSLVALRGLPICDDTLVGRFGSWHGWHDLSTRDLRHASQISFLMEQTRYHFAHTARISSVQAISSL